MASSHAQDKYSLPPKIIYPSYAIMGELFKVIVLDANEMPIAGVSVKFGAEKKETNNLGEVEFIAPYVSVDSFFDVFCESMDFNESIKLLIQEANSEVSSLMAEAHDLLDEVDELLQETDSLLPLVQEIKTEISEIRTHASNAQQDLNAWAGQLDQEVDSLSEMNETMGSRKSGLAQEIAYLEVETEKETDQAKKDGMIQLLDGLGVLMGRYENLSEQVDHLLSSNRYYHDKLMESHGKISVKSHELEGPESGVNDVPDEVSKLKAQTQELRGEVVTFTTTKRDPHYLKTLLIQLILVYKDLKLLYLQIYDDLKLLKIMCIQVKESVLQEEMMDVRWKIFWDEMKIGFMQNSDDIDNWDKYWIWFKIWLIQRLPIEGPPGPRGPQGPQGPPGPVGPIIEHVDEGVRFKIIVTDITALEPLANVQVDLVDQASGTVTLSGTTNQQGYLWFTAPEVVEDRWYIVRTTALSYPVPAGVLVQNSSPGISVIIVNTVVGLVGGIIGAVIIHLILKLLSRKRVSPPPPSG